MDDQKKSSILGWVKEKFGKSNSAATPVSSPKDEENAEQKTVQTEWFSIYGHGFHNALYRISPEDDAFPDYLKQSNELDKILEFKKINDEEIKTLNEKLKTAEEKRERFGNEKAESEEALKTIEEKIEIDTSKISTWQNRNKELFQKREHISPEYGWIPALLFLAAGVLFIMGDISVTADITSTGFDMTKEEGRLFAIGLALTVFLVKPLLDRLFEKPFQKAGFELKKVYRNVLLLITALGLAMLFFLGQFRADSKSLIAELNQVVTQQSESGLSESAMLRLQNEADQINKQLAENWWGQWGIVLSTIVFAIGGAMCLAVAFPSLTHLCNKYWFLPFRRWLNKLLIRTKEKALSNERQKRENEKVKLRKAEKGFSELNIPELKDLIQSARTKQLELIESYHTTRSSKEGELYKDGFNRGWLYSLDGDLKFKVIDPLNTSDKDSSSRNGQPVNGHTTESNEKRAYTRRPFVKIRKMIADNYNNKQNQSNQDGTEFEIVS